MKKKQPSKRSKQLDQKYISIAEIKKNKALVRELRYTMSFFEEDFETRAGRKAWERLENTAKRAKQTPLVYFLTKIAPKL